MLTRYDELDARTELEQEITKELRRALEKRGFTICHNGTSTSCALGGVPDIEVYDDSIHINVEVTKTTKSSADREFLAITDHLNSVKKQYQKKRCYVWYVSPETHYRMINAIKGHNILRKNKSDMKILPLSFFNFITFIDKLISSTKDEFKKNKFIPLFDEYLNFVNDEKVGVVFYEKLFSTDTELKKEFESREESKKQQLVEKLIQDLLKLEQDLRNYRIAMSTEAIRNVIFLVFIKLYEEKKESEGKKNRFTLGGFNDYRDSNDHEGNKKSIHQLFNSIKKNSEIKKSKLLVDSDKLGDKMDDDFVTEFFIKPFSKYPFYGANIDGLGAAYEVLGKLSGKDRNAGQFFTPENVVRFMVKLSDLEYDDVVCDPACGTGRFLIHSMKDMKDKVGGKDKQTKIDHIECEQLFGTDDDSNVSKLAKMNMYIHGDGKNEIMDEDGLLLSHLDEKIDVVLTNPPLGDLNYMLNTYDEDFKMKRMTVIPKKNITQEKLDKAIQRKIKLESQPVDEKIQKKIDGLNQNIDELKFKIDQNESKFKVTGNQMKGGSLFFNAIFHYLKTTRDASQLPEWRGGKLLIILDEAILNTDDYGSFREFIKKYFYIKAVISLTPDTFVPVSNTSTKTSVLYVIKKEDSEAIQQEPVFFAYAEKVGIDTRKRVCKNDLLNDGNDVLSKYRDFRVKVIDSYKGLRFDEKTFRSVEST